MIRRLVAVALVVGAVLGLLRLDRSPEPASGREPSEQPAFARSDRGSVWYCAQVPREGETVQVAVVNTGPRVARARISGYGAAPVEAVPALNVEVGPRSRTVVAVSDLAAGLGGVVVELVGGPGLVEQRVTTEATSDVEACTPDASTAWYFPMANTERGASARLTLMNPFPTDASVDVAVAYDEGGRVPPGLRGLVVAGGTTRVVELGEYLQRREQFTATVRARAGRLVATLSQTGDGEGAGEGLVLHQGASAPSDRWWFADGVGAADVTERFVIMNPADEAVSVGLSVTADAADDLQPEPFVLDLPARRYAVVDLDRESRVPPTGRRWVEVVADGGVGVVVQRLLTVVGAGAEAAAVDRPPVADGLAASGGAAVVATEWVLGSIGLEDGPSVVVVANPDPSAIALVDLVALREGEEVALSEQVEVPPGSSLAVDVTAALGGAEGAPVVVRASTPVVVEARLTSSTRRDVAVLTATPRAGAVGAPPGAG